MTPATSGAVAPFGIVHARDSLGPAVRQVCLPRLSKPMRAKNCPQIRRRPVATHVLGTDIDDPNGRGDRFSHVLVRRCRSIVVGILSRVAHLTHPLKLVQGTVVDEARCRDPGVAMSSAHGSDTEPFGGKNRDERFARTIVRRCERHRVIVGISKQLCRTDMAFCGHDHSQRMLAIPLHTLQSSVREHLIDDLRQGSHRTSHRLRGVTESSRRTATGPQSSSQPVRYA